MKKTLVLTAFLLAACTKPDTGLAPPPKLPDLPPALSKKAEQLPPLTDPTMGGAQVDGARDDAKYNEVAWQLNRLIDVYKCVQTALAEKKDASSCLNAIK